MSQRSFGIYLTGSSRRRMLLVLMFSLFSAEANADGLLDWHRSSLQLMRGYNIELGPEQQTLATFEHSSGYKYGDNYGFFDYSDTNQSYYSEWRTRLSLSKITGQKWSLGPVSDVLVGAQFEFPKGGNHRRAFGVGLSWDVPGFQFVSTNFMNRDDPRFEGSAGLAVLSWGTTLRLGEAPFRFEGFCDFQSSEGSRNGWVLCTPALLLDTGYFSGNEGRLFAGLEFRYWSDKFGAGITSQRSTRLQLKLAL